MCFVQTSPRTSLNQSFATVSNLMSIRFDERSEASTSRGAEQPINSLDFRTEKELHEWPIQKIESLDWQRIDHARLERPSIEQYSALCERLGTNLDPEQHSKCLFFSRLCFCRNKLDHF